MKKFSLCLFLFLSSLNLYAQQADEKSLTAKIAVPYPYSLIRGDVPVYGIACGKDFKSYRLEYGEGDDPQEWKLITGSDKEQKDCGSLSNIDFALDKTIPGNLGLWDTGLTEYQYGTHKADLPMGIYTLKLTVEGRSGQKAEDKIAVEVGRVVLNSFENNLESLDGKAVLKIREHSLYEPVKVFSLKPLDVKKLPVPEGYKLASSVYEINPPGESFNRSVDLEIAYDNKADISSGKVGVFVYEPQEKKWKYLETFRYERENKVKAYIDSIPEKFAVYAVLENKDFVCKVVPEEAVKTPEPQRSVLCRDDFNDSFDQWKKYGRAGAELKLDKAGSKDGGPCLKISNKSERGNFGCTVMSQPFDARTYPIVSFSYKVPKNIKVNFCVKAGGQWFDILFTDDEKVYWDINIKKIGKIDSVIADDQWHKAEFNLYEMLKGHTDNFIVQEMIMADWDSTGFKKLEFGKSPKDATFYIDDFEIRSDRHFWQIGYKDLSGKEFSQAGNGEEEAVYHVGEPFSSFPSKLTKKIKIMFTINEDDAKHVYSLNFGFIIDCKDKESRQMEICLNDRPVLQSNYPSVPSEIGVLLQYLRAGENVITLSNLSNKGMSFDHLSLQPLQDIPWKVRFSDSQDKSDGLGYSIGIDNTEKDTGKVDSVKQRLNFDFGAYNKRPSYTLKLITMKQKTPDSFIILRKFGVFINGKSLQECYYSGDKEVLTIPVPGEYIKKGINLLKIEWLSGNGDILFKELSLE